MKKVLQQVTINGVVIDLRNRCRVTFFCKQKRKKKSWFCAILELDLFGQIKFCRLFFSFRLQQNLLRLRQSVRCSRPWPPPPFPLAWLCPLRYPPLSPSTRPCPQPPRRCSKPFLEPSPRSRFRCASETVTSSPRSPSRTKTWPPACRRKCQARCHHRR